MLRNVTRAIVGLLGYKIVKPASGYRVVKSAKWNYTSDIRLEAMSPETLTYIRSNTMLNELVLANIIETTEYVLEAGISGDFVECGVWKGGSVALMAYVMNAKGDRRELHLFDSFGDICEPDARLDGERAVKEVGGIDFAQGRLRSVAGVYDNRGGGGNELLVERLIVSGIGYPAERIHLHKGWFQETVPATKEKIESIALLRLDGDWYASTKVCLEHLYDKVSNGGIIIVDDYGAYDGCRRAVEEFWAQRNIRPNVSWVNGDCIFWVKKK